MCPAHLTLPYSPPGSSAQIHTEEQEAERPKAARVSKSDVESLHGVRVPVCLMAALRKSTVLTDSSPPLVILLHLSPQFQFGDGYRHRGDVSEVHATKAEPVCERRSVFLFLSPTHSRKIFTTPVVRLGRHYLSLSLPPHMRQC